MTERDGIKPAGIFTMTWEHFDHGADIGVRGYGANPAEAFVQAALALTAVVTDPATVNPTCGGRTSRPSSRFWLKLYTPTFPAESAAPARSA